MIIAKECLKLPLCPLCKKPKDASPKLIYPPLYECSDCKVEWNENGMRSMERDNRFKIIEPNGEIKYLD